jgi:hypothetical protein
MNIRRDLEAALDSWASDGHEALLVADKILAYVRALLHQHLGRSFSEIDLLLADLRRDARKELFDLTRNTVDRDTVIDIVAQRFFGED